MKSKLSSSKRHYGWVPDVPDHRDHLYAAPVEWLTKLPAKVDLRQKCPAVYDQGQLGSCTANAIAAAIEFEPDERENEILHAVAIVHLLQRARNGGNGRLR